MNVVQSGQPAVAPATKLRISFSQMTSLRWSLLDEVLQLKASGYDGIGLWRPMVSHQGEELAADLIREVGLGVSSLSFIGGFTGTNGLSFSDAIADARDALSDAELLGADNVIVCSGTRNGHTTRHSRRLLVEAMSELSDDAGQRGIRLCVLPMHPHFASSWTFLNTLDETLQVLDEVNQHNVRLAFDTYHLWQEPQLLERIPLLAPLTGIVQIGDAECSPRADAERLMPGDGIIPLGEIVGGFQRAGFDGYYDVQVWSSSGWSGESPVDPSQCREAVLRLARMPVSVAR